MTFILFATAVAAQNSINEDETDDDYLSRFPNLYSPGGLLRGLDYGGTISFALSGSIIAAKSGLDVFGCVLVGMITAVGGGTIRDAVFLARRPFWTSETEYIWIMVTTGFVTFFMWPAVMRWNQNRRARQQNLECVDKSCGDECKDDISVQDKRRNFNGNEKNDADHFFDYPISNHNLISTLMIEINGKTRNKKDADNCKKRTDNYDWFDAALDTFDAFGLSAFTIVGTQNGVRAGMPIVVSAICGVCTSTFGGVIRDVLCGRPVRIVHSNAEVYSETALVGAFAYLGANSMHISPWLRLGSAMFLCLISRFVAVKYDIKLHTWETEDNRDGFGVAVRK